MDLRSNSLAVTPAKYAQLKPVIENTDKYDFIPPTTHVDCHQEQQRQNLDLPSAYTLRQTTPDTQSLCSIDESVSTSSIVRRSKRKALGRKPLYVEVLKYESNLEQPIAEFDSPEDGHHRITYLNAGINHFDSLVDVGEKHYRCSINDKAYMWQPLGPSKTVMVLSSESDTRVALLVQSGAVTQRSGSYPGSLKRFKSEDIGEIHVMSTCAGSQEMLERILCSAVVLANRMRPKITTY